MLHRDQIELIHREIDGANTPDERAAFQRLVAEHPEAGALHAELRRVARLLEGVEARDPPPGLKPAILARLAPVARTAPQSQAHWSSPIQLIRRALSPLRAVTQFLTEPLENAIMTKKTILIGSTAIAAVVVIAGLITGFPPTSATSGTIGGDPIPGVQQASRYQGRPITPSEVTLSNPEYSVLLQNHDVPQAGHQRGLPDRDGERSVPHRAGE